MLPSEEEAAVTGDYGTLMQAFALNQLIIFGDKAKRCMDELLVAYKKYLPQFAARIEELEKAGVMVTDPIARQLCREGL